MTTSSRAVAYRCLQRVDQDGAYANLVTPAELGRSELPERDRKFVTDLVYGTTRMRRACDALVDRFLATEPVPEIRTLLRLGAYQLVFAGVAPHAAVGETVALAPKRLRGFVNAVLRNVGRVEMQWPSEAVRLSYPDWLFDRLVGELDRTGYFRSADRRTSLAETIKVMFERRRMTQSEVHLMHGIIKELVRGSRR